MINTIKLKVNIEKRILYLKEPIWNTFVLHLKKVLQHAQYQTR